MKKTEKRLSELRRYYEVVKNSVLADNVKLQIAMLQVEIIENAVAENIEIKFL